MSVRETLELDIAAALASVSRFGDQLQNTAAAFGDQLNQAINAALQDIPIVRMTGDASAVTSELDQAVAAGQDTKEVDGDASAVTSDIDEAVAAGEDVKQVDGDATAVTSEIDEAVAAGDSVVDVTADATEVTAAIDEAVAGASAVVDVTADTGAATADIDALGGSLGGATAQAGGLDGSLTEAAVAGRLLGSTGTSVLQSLTKPLTGATIAGVALGGAVAGATMEFVNFEAALSEVRTLLPGMTDDEFAAMAEEVRLLGMEMNMLPSEIIPALYTAISSGIPKDNVMEFLTVAAKTSIGGVTDIGTAVGGLTTILNAWQLEQDQVTVAADSMFQAMKGGRTTIGELSGSLFQVAPIASATGVSFQEINAALATITAVTATPTRRAANQLKAAFGELSQQGSQASDIFLELSGKTFTEFMEAGGTVQEAFLLMKEAADENGVSVNNYFSRMEAGQAILTLTGAGHEKFTAEMLAQAEATGAADEAYNTMRETLDYDIGSLQGEWENLRMEIGKQFAPVLARLVENLQGLTDVVLPQLMRIVQEVGDGFIGLTKIIDGANDAVGAVDDLLGSVPGPSNTLFDWTDVFTGIADAVVRMLPGLGMVITALRAVGLVAGIDDTADDVKDLGDKTLLTSIANAALTLSIRENVVETQVADDRWARFGERLVEARERIAMVQAGFGDLTAAAVANVPSVNEAFQSLSAEVGTEQILADLDAAFAGTVTWTDSMTAQLAAGNDAIVALMSELGPEKSAILLATYDGDLAQLEAHLDRLYLAELNAQLRARQTMVLHYLEAQQITGDEAQAIVDELGATLILEDPTAESVEAAAKKIDEARWATAAKERAQATWQALIDERSQFVTAGQSVGQGFIDGMVSKAADIQRAGVQMVTDAYLASKGKARINSPSLLFADLGNELVEGLALGLNDTNLAVTSSQQLVSAVATPLERAALSAPAGVGGTVAPANISVTVPVTVTAGMTPDDGRRIGEAAGQAAEMELRRVYRMEAMLA